MLLGQNPREVKRHSRVSGQPFIKLPRGSGDPGSLPCRSMDLNLWRPAVTPVPTVLDMASLDPQEARKRMQVGRRHA